MVEQSFSYNDEFLPKPEQVHHKDPKELQKRRKRAQDDRDGAQKNYSDIWFALQVDDWNEKFYERDRAALKLKDGFILWGTVAISFGVTALLITFFQLLVVPILPISDNAEETLRTALPAIAFVLFFTGVALSWRGGIGNRKQTWLGERMFLERIRCWRWQYFVATIPDILDAIGDGAKKQAYLERRHESFQKAWTGLSEHSHGAIKNMIDHSKKPDLKGTDRFNINKKSVPLNLVEGFKDKARRIQNQDTFETAPEAHQRQIIQVYHDLRMAHQHGYADYQVKPDKGKLKSHPGRQEHTFEAISKWLLYSSVLFEAVLIILTLIKSRIYADGVLPDPLMVSLALGQFAIFAVVAIAFGLKAMQHSLRTPVQVARLKGYRDEVDSIKQEYGKPDGPRIGNSIISLERAAYNEMCEFLETGARSVFLL